MNWPAAPVVGRAELARRVAAVRKAKIAKMADPLSWDDHLTEGDLDAALAGLDDTPAKPLKAARGLGRKPILPCAACKDPKGHVPKGCIRPVRVDAARFGIPGSVCRRCYDQLKAPTQRARPSRQLKAAARAVRRSIEAARLKEAS